MTHPRIDAEPDLLVDMLIGCLTAAIGEIGRSWTVPEVCVPAAEFQAALLRILKHIISAWFVAARVDREAYQELAGMLEAALCEGHLKSTCTEPSDDQPQSEAHPSSNNSAQHRDSEHS